MVRKKFDKKLRKSLKGLSRQERQEVIDYYNEMIDDSIESGKTEEQAIEELGSPEDLSKKILSENYPVEPISADKGGGKKKKSGLKPLWILLIIIGSPLWLGLAIGAAGLIVGLLAGVLGLVVGLFAACAGLVVGGVGATVYGVIMLFIEFGYGLACAGGGICSFAFGALAAIGLFKLCKYLLGLRRKSK